MLNLGEKYQSRTTWNGRNCNDFHLIKPFILELYTNLGGDDSVQTSNISS